MTQRHALYCNATCRQLWIRSPRSARPSKEEQAARRRDGRCLTCNDATPPFGVNIDELAEKLRGHDTLTILVEENSLDCEHCEEGCDLTNPESVIRDFVREHNDCFRGGGLEGDDPWLIDEPEPDGVVDFVNPVSGEED